ncbi:DMT family transporter [Novosphingobium sp. KCTC 2891]|uniref:DMT family transporter n=1 Tax=Novosphingobium sp. KCTC 2891 TaxID=2989730 RepID=UPI00222225BB|nr:DMT family transporter [Novosphingobium sp. KCTC 2891]MCW1383459.1 DMT family transporter [Novosphingobium sp. KCTC 2891]
MPTYHRPMLALGLRLGAMLMLSVMLLLVKLTGERGIWLPETMFWRQLIPALGIFGWLAARGQLGRLKTARPWIHARRAFIGTSGMFLTLGVVQILPLAESTVLGFTAPIFAVVLSALLLKEHVGPWRWAAVLLGLAGIVVIAGPDRAHLPLLGLAVGIGAAFMVALVSIQLRDLGRTEEPLTVVFWFSAMSAPFLALFLLKSGASHDAAGWLMILGIGITGLFAQILMTAALRFGSVASVIVMDYSQFGWATLWGVLFFAHLPPATTLLGAPLIVGAGLVIAWREQVLTRQRMALLNA